MKKIAVILIALTFGMSAFAQVETKIEKPGIQKGQKVSDCYVMKDGKVWNMKDNKSTPLENEVTLSNGTRLKPEGTVITKNGEITVLNEGDKVYADGQIEKSTSKKQMGERE